VIPRLLPAALFFLLGAGPALALDDLLYELAPAGSYELPVIDRVQEHRLLDADGERATLTGLAPEQCALISFVYLSCNDATGCPLALASIQRLDRALADRSDLAGRVRLVTVSFDPERDKPEQMAGLRHHMKPKTDWRFLTARDPEALEPVLVDYGQDVVPLFSAEGKRLSVLRHVAKVFLVDGKGAIRNVYSSGFLDHRILLRDVETLLLTGANDPHP
jgi:cytochrome oxidase Cu insertion factor (SCO1/SenC/PrrC family)